MRYIRIELKGNESRLVYRRGIIEEYSKIIGGSQYLNLTYLYSELRRSIASKRRELRSNSDKIINRESGHFSELLRRKIRDHANIALRSKKPINFKRHIGVEIEFISSSSKSEIALTLAKNKLVQFVELKTDGSVRGYSDSDDCNGNCRSDCNCADCGETHYCDDEYDCRRKTRDYGSHKNDSGWIFKDYCADCETETVYSTDENGVETSTEVVKCEGHCVGHYCLGYDDHENYDCNCECDCSSNYGHEICIVAGHKQIREVISKVCAVLAEHGASVNDTCGLHVHLDARKKDESVMFHNLVNSQKVLYSMVPERRYNSNFCQISPNTDMSDYDGRYWGVNPKSYSEHRTIEVRLHSGTTNATKINNWINLLSKIAYSKDKLDDSVTLEQFFKQVKINSSLQDYIKTRIDKFKKRRKQLLTDSPSTEVVEELSTEVVNSENNSESIAA